MIPLFIISGFLGSGKTTLLNALLASPAMAGSAIVVNEIGEIGIDHDLVVQAEEQALVLSGGCICCSMRGTAVEKITQLIEARPAPIRRILLETTGVADPLPIISALVSAPTLFRRAAFRQLVTVVDGLAGHETLARREVARRQVRLADTLLISKADIASRTERASTLRAARALNALAPIGEIARGRSPDAVISALSRLDTAPFPRANLEHGRDAVAAPGHGHGDDDFHTAAVRFPGELPHQAIEAWLEELLSCFGSYVLRVKGLFRVAGIDAPVVLHAVQHIASAPETLPEWPSEDRHNRVVVIAVGMDASLLEDSLAWLASRAR
jgi:G3E family GTPase